MAKTQKSVLSSFKSMNKSLKKHKDNDVVINNFGDLPAGVIGIAKVLRAQIGIYATGNNKGKPFFQAYASVVTPAKFGDVPIEGMSTSIIISLCDTANKTEDENVQAVINELKKLGLDTSEIESGEDLEELVNEIEELGIYTKFSTSAGTVTPQYPNPRVFHNWNGVTEYDSDEVEEEDEEEEEKTTKSKSTKKETAKPTKKKAKTKEVDLDELAELADDEEDEEAAEKLKEIAVEAGISEKTVDKARSWKAVVSLIEKAKDDKEEDEDLEEDDENDVEEDTDSEDEENEEASLEVGEIVLYKPKGKKKAVDCEILKINEKKGTVNLVNISDKTKYNNVPMEDVDSED